MEDIVNARSALVIGHPGHELRLHHWLELAHPLTFVLTDGSGRMAASRLASTTSLLRNAGARLGSIYGRWTDQALYAAILARDPTTLSDLARELALTLADNAVEYVVA